ncbi:MAG: TniQ family protein [Negativicutes bacterium]|nr:TniQ family protein [Negativicutes bacterium]
MFYHLMPPRSEYYNLEPINIGTHRGEGMLSYISRLAMEHKVNQSVFINKAIIPAIRCMGIKIYNQFKKKHAISVNGGGAAPIIKALSNMTGCQDLEMLTLNRFCSSFNSIGLFSRVRRWCPLCFDENTGIIYEPLIWSVNQIISCELHGIQLVEQCPHCYRQNAHYTYNLRGGFCSWCEGWLGRDENLKSIQLNKWELWLAKNIGELIACPKEGLGQQNVFEKIKQAVDLIADGNKTRFGEILGGYSHATVHSWYYGKTIPSMEIIGKIAFISGNDIVSFVTGETKVSPKMAEIFEKKSYQRNLNKIDREAIEEKLIEIINEDALPSPTIKSVADKLNVSWKFIRNNYRDMYDIIVQRGKSYRKSEGLKKAKQRDENIRTKTIELHNMGINPTKRTVAKELSISALIFSDELAWKKARKELGY